MKRSPSTGRYEIGIKVVRLAYGALHTLHLRNVAKPVLYRLAAETGLWVFLAVLDDARAVLVEKVETEELSKMYVATRLDMEIGIQLPLHATAVGKALLSQLPCDEVLRVLGQRGLPKCSHNTKMSKCELLEELDLIRERGYSRAEEEYRAGIRVIGVPIHGLSGGLVAAISVGGTLYQPAWGEPSEVITRVKRAAREISKEPLDAGMAADALRFDPPGATSLQIAITDLLIPSQLRPGQRRTESTHTRLMAQL